MKEYYDVWDRLTSVLSEENYERIAYVYRIDKQGNVTIPYLAKLFADEDLIDNLRDDFGGGEFRILIREGRKMVFSGEISICPRPNSNLHNDYQ